MYILNILLILIYGFFLFYLFNNKYSKIIFSILVFLQFTIIVGLRSSNIGVDTEGYFEKFLGIKHTSIFDVLTQKEPGYALLQKVMATINANPHFFLFITAIIIYFILAIFIYKFSYGMLTSYITYLALGFFFFSLTGIRQSIAISIILLSYKFILNKSIFKFLVTVLLASSFHLSALVFLPAYFISYKKLNKFYLFSLILLFSLLFLFRYQIGNLLMNLYYDDSSLSQFTYETSSGIGGTALFILCILIIGFVFVNPVRIPFKQNIVLMNITIISFFLQLLSSYSYLFTRLNMYYMVFLTLYIPYIMFNFNHNNSLMNFSVWQGKINKLVFISALIIFGCGYYIYRLFEERQITPYEFFFS